MSLDLYSIPNFRLLGDPTTPTILSNKIILTPPAPGNQRGAVWGDKTLQHTGWTADIDFRATGPERGGGKLTVWLARNGQYEVGASSIYTVGKFEGLALNIDTYAGTVWSSFSYLGSRD
jgi:lectin, mannose-binding 1